MTSWSGEPGLTPGVGSSPVRGTVGTVAPAGRISPMLWAVAVGYVLVAGALVWVAACLAPWGLLLLLVALGALAAAVAVGFIAVGIARVEEDEAWTR